MATIDVLPPHTPYPRWEVTGTATEGYITINVMQSGNIDVKQESKCGQNLLLQSLQAVCNTVKQEPPNVLSSEGTEATEKTTGAEPKSSTDTEVVSLEKTNAESELLEKVKEKIMFEIKVRLLRFVQPRGIDIAVKSKKISTETFECAICGRSFKRKSYLEIHREIHMNERKHECKMCGKRFNTQKNLKSHTFTHKYRTKIHKCELCDKSFMRNSYLAEHMKIHANRKSYKCDTCGKGFNSSCTLSRHKRIHLFPAHDSEESGSENVDSNLIASGNEGRPNNAAVYGIVESNAKTTDNEHGFKIKEDVDEPYAVQDVDDSIVKQEIFEDSEGIQFGENDAFEETFSETNAVVSVRKDECEAEYKFHCDKCNRRFKTEKYWMEHVESKCNVRPAKCEICGQEMKFRDLNLHLRYKHGQKRQFSCKVCGEKFPTKSKMTKHRELHGDKPYPCDICGKAFLTKLQLEWHRDAHSGEAKHSCEKCGKTFNTIVHLRGHMRGHEDTENWTCDICGKHFTAKRKIWDHKRMHEKKEENEEKKWQCTLCGVTFKRKDYLKTHMEGHLDERNYSCSVCGKKFNTKKNVRSHMRTHETEPKFQCDLCGKSFVRKDSFRIHKMTHNSEKTHECEVCGKSFNMFSGLYHHRKIHVRQAAKAQQAKEISVEIDATHDVQFVYVGNEQTVHTS